MPDSPIVSENEHVAKLKARWPRMQDNDAVLLETISIADEAVSAFPQSSQLWCILGDVIQLGPEGSPHSLDNALMCYQRATEVDPQCIEAWESLGHFHSAVLDDESKAQGFFSEAERLRALIAEPESL